LACLALAGAILSAAGTVWADEFPVPAFEEMAAPDPGDRASAAPTRLAPIALIPRSWNMGAASVGTPRVAETSFRVAPHNPAPVPEAAPAQAGGLIPVSLPSVAPQAVPMAISVPSPGGRMVQLGAFRSRDEAGRSLDEWRHAVPAVFAGAAAPAIVTADLGEKGIFYRIRVPGFSDSRKAGDFCAAYKGADRDCFIVP
jgi:cell division septation protein DedD